MTLRSMTMSKLRMVAAGIAMALSTAGGAIGLVQGEGDQPAPGPVTATARAELSPESGGKTTAGGFEATPAVEGPEIDEVAAVWLYPGAKDALSAGKPSFYSTMFDAEDDLPSVLKYYSKLLRVEAGNFGAAGQPIGVQAGSVGNGESYIIVRSASASAYGIDEVTFTYKTRSTLTNLVLHQDPGRKSTRVAITHAELQEERLIEMERTLDRILKTLEESKGASD
jgi:hypothetical protein